jgi:mxaC protein
MSGFLYPWLLLLLPLAWLPWRRAQPALSYSFVELLPEDPLSSWIERLLRVLGSLAIAALVFGLAQPYRSGVTVERIARGTEIVLLLDRSRSMDMPFVTRTGDPMLLARGEPKVSVARRLLAQFVAQRPADNFAILEFSRFPIPVLEFTRKPQILQAIINASRTGRGLEDTDVGRALERAIQFFDGRRYLGSRVIMLVSDGGARIDAETRQRITVGLRRERISLYWLYIRSYHSPGLMSGQNVSSELAEASPEHDLDEFFSSTGMPYRAYEAENPRALGAAIQDVERLESAPIRYTETLPQLQLAPACFALALLCSLLLLGAKSLELGAWR